MLYTALRALLRFLLQAWFPLRIAGQRHLPREGPVILAANHGSLLDPLLLIVASPRPVRFLINEDMYHSLLFGWLVRGIGGILVWRSRPLASGRLEEALEALAQGDVVGIFPEGTITGHGRLRHLRPGLAVLRLKSGAPLVPAGLAGTVKALPFEGTVPKAETPLCAVFGAAWPACEPAEPTDASVAAVTDKARRALQRVHQVARERRRRRRTRPWVPFVVAAVVVVPVAWLMSNASRDREAGHRARLQPTVTASS